MKIRSATIQDARAIKRVLCDTSGVWQDSWRDNTVEIAIANAGNLALVAECDDEIVAFACFHDCGFRAYLSEMVVAEPRQEKGIGTALLAEACRLLRNKGCKLIVADAHPPAKDFYFKNGWVTPKAVLIARDT